MSPQISEIGPCVNMFIAILLKEIVLDTSLRFPDTSTTALVKSLSGIILGTFTVDSESYLIAEEFS